MASPKYRSKFRYTRLTASQKKRCIKLPLYGRHKFTLLKLFNPRNARLLPRHIEFYFGSSNILVLLSNGEMETLDKWLAHEGKHIFRLEGFLGPARGSLYIVLHQEAVL